MNELGEQDRLAIPLPFFRAQAENSKTQRLTSAADKLQLKVRKTMKKMNLPLTLAQFSGPLIAALALLRPYPAFSQNDRLGPQDFSNTNSVTLLLAEAERG